MKLDDDVRRCVAFVGHADEKGENFKAKGTAFYVAFEEYRYLVTARHIAEGLGDAPFCVRVNRTDDASDIVFCDPLIDGFQWYSHDDPNVDIAVMPWHLRDGDMDMLAVAQELLHTDEKVVELGVGPGGLCHAVGLFRLLQGDKRNVPIIHTGHIALMPSDQLIPVQDWTAPVSSNKRKHVRAYLVEMSNLKGLSGSPVLVRPSTHVLGQRFVALDNGAGAPLPGQAFISAYSADVHLLGVWSASWDARPDEVAAVEAGEEVRVPIGMGAVVPTGRLLEILKSDAVVAQRTAAFEAMASRRAASADQGGG